METLLASGSTALTGDAYEIAKDVTVTIVATGPGNFRLQARGLSSAWTTVMVMSGSFPDKAACQITGPVFIRADRPLQGNVVAAGVDDGT